MTRPNTQHLRQIVADRLDIHWTQFAREHQHLAAAIERTRLVDSAVRSITNDPSYVHAQKAATQDETFLDGMDGVTALADRWVRRLLGL